MKAKLPPAAYDEASTIASNYLNYLSAVEKQMAGEAAALQKTETRSVPADAEDAERFAARIAQISRLRQSILGVQIAQLWYAEEEAGMQQSLAEKRQFDANSQLPNNR
jgi:hypothetical protein